MRKRGIIATVIFVTVLVSAIPVVSNLFDIYNEPLDLDSPLVFNDRESAPDEESESSKNEQDEEPLEDDSLEATEIADYQVILSDEKLTGVQVVQSDFSVTVTGTLFRNSVSPRGQLSFDFYAPKELPEETLKNLSVVLPSEGNKTYTQKKDKILERNKKGDLYFTLALNANSRKSVPVEVDWGDGFIITYLIVFNLSIR